MPYEDKLLEIAGSLDSLIEQLRQVRFDYVRSKVSVSKIDSYDKSFERRLSQAERALVKAVSAISGATLDPSDG